MKNDVPCEKEAVFRLMPSHFKLEGCGTTCLTQWGFCLLFPPPLTLSSPPLSAVSAFWSALISRELWFLKGFSMSLIPPSLCVQAKNISAWNSRGRQGPRCEKKTSFFPTICGNRKKKGELLLKKKKKIR